MEEALFSEELLGPSMYHRHLTRWLDRYPRERLHVILDLDLREDSLVAVQDAFQFLGVDPDFVPESLDSRVNAAGWSRRIDVRVHRWAQRLRGAGFGPLVGLGRRLGVDKAVQRADRAKRPYPPIEPELDARLRKELRPDVEALERLIGRELAAWLPRQEQEIHA
jgi:hypothetical protein